MNSAKFQQLVAALGELTEAQRQTVASALSGRGSLVEVTSMIEARFSRGAQCPQCGSLNVGTWAEHLASSDIAAGITAKLSTPSPARPWHGCANAALGRPALKGWRKA